MNSRTGGSKVYRDPQSGQTFLVAQPTAAGAQRIYGSRSSSSSSYMSGAGGCLTGTVVFLFVVVAGLAVLSGIALGQALYTSSTAVLTSAGTLPSSPYALRLDGTTPVAALLPNDLHNYVGRTFYLYSLSAQAHTVTISAGTLTTTWDGSNTVATFGGAIGDGLAFHVLDRDKIVVVSNTNVVFS